MSAFAEALKASNQKKTFGSIIKSTTVPNLVQKELQRQRQEAKANTGEKTLRETDRDAYDQHIRERYAQRTGTARHQNSGMRFSRLAMESGEEGFDQAAWDRAGVKAKKFMESLHLDTPFPPPPNYDPNNPIDRLAWERAGVKAEKFVSEIDWNGPLSHFSNKARGTSWNPSGGFGGSAHDSVDTKSNMTDNGRTGTGGNWLDAWKSLLSVTGSFLGGARDSVESSAEGIVTTVKHPVKTAKAIAEINPQEAADALFEIISDEVIHGDEQTRARFFGQATGEILTQVLGTKGLGSVAKITAVSKAVGIADTAKLAGKSGKALRVRVNLTKSRSNT